MFSYNKHNKMAENQEQTVNFREFAYANVAGQLAQSKRDAGYVTVALDKLVDDMNVPSQYIDGFKQGAFASEKGIQTSINAYSNTYHEEMGKLKVKDVYSWYESTLKDAPENGKEKTKAVFDKYGEENFGKLRNEISKASYILNGEAPKDTFSEDDMKKAEKTLEKYKDFKDALIFVEKYKFEELRVNVIEKSRKSELENLVKNFTPVENRR